MNRSVPASGAVTLNQTVFESLSRVHVCTGSLPASVAPRVSWTATDGRARCFESRRSFVVTACSQRRILLYRNPLVLYGDGPGPRLRCVIRRGGDGERAGAFGAFAHRGRLHRERTFIGRCGPAAR